MEDIKLLINGDIKSIIVLFIFIVCDMISGVIGASIESKLKSSEFRKGLLKKCLEILLVIIGYCFDVIMGLKEIGIAVVIFEIAMEGYSILENIKKYIPLPDILVKVLNTLQKDETKPEEVAPKFAKRTTAPTIDDDAYYWPSTAMGQCTWYCYYRCVEAFGKKPCWRNGSGSEGSEGFANAKNWSEHPRDPFVYIAKGNTKAQAGDVAVFDGNAGHVVFIEEVDNDKITYTDYNMIAPKTFNYATVDYTNFVNLNGNNSLKGYLRIK